MNKEVKQLLKQRESLKLERSAFKRNDGLEDMKTLELESACNADGLSGKLLDNLGPDNLRAGDVLKT